jgi:hypothetical protein
MMPSEAATEIRRDVYGPVDAIPVMGLMVLYNLKPRLP